MRRLLLEEIKLCLRGWQFEKYQRSSDFVDAILRIVFRASSREEEIELLTYALTNAGFEIDNTDFEAPQGNGVDDNTFSYHANRLSDCLIDTVQGCLRENVVSAEFGRRVLDWLETLQSREAKTVGLTMLMQGPLIPYVRLPDYLRGTSLIVGIDNADFEKMPVRESLAILRRVFGPFGLCNVPIVAFAAIIQKVLASHKEQSEIQLILTRALRWFMEYVDRRRSEDGAQMFGGVIEDFFAMIKRGGVTKEEDAAETGKSPRSGQSKRILN